jgi:hypothetical protein
LVALLAAAVYYRFARHDAGKYYLLFGAWIVVLAHLCISLRQEFKLTTTPPSPRFADSAACANVFRL